jgi:hypothetical protein
MSMDWFNENAGSSNPGVYFGQIGAKVVGEILSTPRPSSFKDEISGRESNVLIVDLRAAEGSTATKGKKGADGPIQPGDELALFLRAGLMAQAVSQAIKEAGAKGLAAGDTIAVAYSEDKDTGRVQPAKVYQARYTPAKAAVSVDNLV